MSRKRNKSKKSDLVREVTTESEEKWRGLENKTYIVAEFGFYIVLIAFTIFAVGIRYQFLEDRKDKVIDDSTTVNIVSNNDTFYYDVSNRCTDLEECYFELNEDYQGKEVAISYEIEEGLGKLKIDDVIIETKKLSEFALLKNGYIATFEVGNYMNAVSYYDAEGNLVKEYNTKLDSTGDLSSDIGVYAVCNNRHLNVFKYNIQGEEFNEEVIGELTDTRC